MPEDSVTGPPDSFGFSQFPPYLAPSKAPAGPASEVAHSPEPPAGSSSAPAPLYPAFFQSPYAPFPVAQQPPPAPVVGIIAIIFAFVFFPIGLIMGIIGLCIRPKTASNTGLSLAAVTIGITSILLIFVGFAALAGRYAPLFGR